ncbi:MAG: hypothetical protein QM820_13255 [Minicystis sp.]
MTYASAPSPAYPIAAQLLAVPRITLAPRIPIDRHLLAVAAIGTGLDHLAGEIPLALSDEHTDADRFTDGVLFTDRRLLARTGDSSVEMPYPALQDVRLRSGVIIDDLDLTAWNRVYTLEGLPAVQATAAFLRALLQMPPGYRVPPPRALATPSVDDPTGGLAARHDIWSRDVRVLPLLGMAIEGHRQGWLAPAMGFDLVTRAMLFDRTLAYGRGAHEGWWTSPIGGPDLAYAFTRMLGEPTRVWQDGHARVFDFRLNSGSNAGAAAASTAVGLLALGVFGVGWVSTPGRSLSSVRLKVAPGNASCGFALYDENGAKLSQSWSPLVKTLFEILPRIEGRMLIQRAAFGWDVPPEQLDDMPVEALFRKVAETIGEIEIGIYFPKPPPK